MSNPISGFSKLSKAQKIEWLTKTYFKANEQATDVLKEVLELRQRATKTA